MDAINILEMTVLNEGNKPTFMTENRSEVIDITFINKYAENTVINWRVSNTETFSDHNQIEYIVLSEDKNKPRNTIPFSKDIPLNVNDNKNSGIYIIREAIPVLKYLNVSYPPVRDTLPHNEF